MQPAYTVDDARSLHASALKTVHRKLTTLPEGLVGLTDLTSLDASDNPIDGISAGQLPPNITELTLTGCQLTSVPACLTKLIGLQQLHLAANNICQAEALFACPQLIHAGLSFNHISGLKVATPATQATPSPPASPTRTAQAARQFFNNASAGSQAVPLSPQHPSNSASVTGKQTSSPGAKCSNCGSSSGNTARCSPLMSLDLSYNDITDLPPLLAELKQLSQLKSLSLKGNPVSLLPSYREAVLHQLTQLLYLDGQKLDGISIAPAGSRPGTRNSIRRPASARPGSASGSTKQLEQQQQPSFTAAFSGLLAPAEPKNVPLLLWLELGKQQLTEAAEQLFTKQAAELLAKQQQLLQEAVSSSGASGNSSEASAASAPGGVAIGSAAAAATGKEQNSNIAGFNPGATTTATGPAAADAAGAGVPGSADAGQAEVQAALKHVTYHMELEAPDGALMCSLPLVVQPPNLRSADKTATTPSAALDSKKGAKGAKPGDSKAPAVAKPKPGAGRGSAGKGRASVDSCANAAGAGAPQLTPGGLQVVLQLPATLAGRDWLRQGFGVKLLRTQQVPVAGVLQPAVPSAVGGTAPVAASTGSKQTAAAASKANTGNKTEPMAPAPATIVWQYEPQQQPLGTAKVVAADLLDSCGQQQTLEGSAEFIPPAPLFNDANGTLLSLKKATTKQKAAGSCRYRLVLHWQPPSGPGA